MYFVQTGEDEMKKSLMITGIGFILVGIGMVFAPTMEDSTLLQRLGEASFVFGAFVIGCGITMLDELRRDKKLENKN